NTPLPGQSPALPIDLPGILVSDRAGLADFQDMEPDLCFNSLYGEFEADMSLVDTDDMRRWCSLVTTIANEYQLPAIAEDAWPVLVNTAIRAIGDQGNLPLSPTLIARTLREAALHSNDVIDAQALNETLAVRRWREGYLAERMHDEIELGQILIETEGEVIGQINGLSV
ncbi:MAG: Lon protease family protein, partial [Hafnia sp.]